MLLTQDEIGAMVDVANELANATLVEIAGPGALDRNGDPGTPVTVWTGEAPGVLLRARRESTTGDREQQGRTTSFHVFDAVAPADELAGAVFSASTVVIRDETGPTAVETRWTVKGRVKDTEGTLDSVTLELDNESTP